MSDEELQAGGVKIDTLKPVRRGISGVGDVLLDPELVMKPKQNSCVYLGPRSRADTKLKFSQFFGSNHTIAGWFMPQYPRADCGPMFASSGTGRFFVGQGDYRTGNAITAASTLAPGVKAVAGDAVLTVWVGSTKAIYLAPSWEVGVWQHIAYVRSGNTLRLYLNGTLLSPVTITTQKDADGKVLAKTVSPQPNLSLPASPTSATLGSLVLGRAPHPWLKAFAQAYGLLDDVAVFDHALSTTELSKLVAGKRLTGFEQGLIQGWGFDSPAAGIALPPKLAGVVDKQAIGPNIKVSDDRNSKADAWLLDFPFVYANNTHAVRFPFPKGQPWKVTQGYCDPITTHHGYAAFCYDLVRVDAASPGSSIHACEGGNVFRYKRNGTLKPESNYREPNSVAIYNDADDCAMGYLHFEGNTLTKAVVDGDPPAQDPDDFVYPAYGSRLVSVGQELGLDGKNAAHLHLGGLEMLVSGLTLDLAAATVPVAFTDIEVLSPGDADWHGVFGTYIPKKGDQVRAKS